MDMSDKLTRAQRQQIIFNHLKGKDDPLYEVIETNNGKYIVRPKQFELEEETINEPQHEEVEEEEEETINEPPPKPVARPKTDRHKRTKQEARRILDALTNLIKDSSDEYSDDDVVRAPPLVEPNNFNPQQLSFRRRKLAF